MKCRDIIMPVLYWCLLSLATPANAQQGTAAAPQLFRFNEVYDGLPDSLKNKAWLKIKNLSLASNLKASFGFNYREMIESVKSDAPGGLEDTYWLTRMTVHADLKWKNQYRVFLQAGRSIIQGKKPPVRPIDEDQLYVLNGFAEVELGKQQGNFLRVGRQELLFGAGRLVAPREGPNVRNSFDGVLYQYRHDNIKSNWFYATVVQNKPGVLDDHWFDNRSALWGAYNTATLKQLRIDFYYLGYRNNEAAYGGSTGKGREIRHSAGVRLFGNLSGAFLYDAECTYQFGEFKDLRISAFEADAKCSYRFPWQRSPLQINAKMGYSSGDRSARDRTLNLFNPLFPNLLYYQTAVGLFPANLINPQLSVNGRVDKLRWLLSADAFWRATAGGLFAPFGTIPLPASSNRYLGYQLALKGDYELNTNAELSLLVSRYIKSSFIEKNPDPRGIDLLINLLLNIKF